MWAIVETGLETKAGLSRRAFAAVAAGGLIAGAAGADVRYRVVDLGVLDGETSQALDLNENGQVVGDSDHGVVTSHAFLWQDGVMLDLGVLDPDDDGPAFESQATAINESGQAVGWSERSLNDSRDFAVRFVNGEPINLGTLGGEESRALAINDDGVIVGWAHDGENDRRGFEWDGFMRRTVDLGGVESETHDINNRRDYCGWSDDLTGRSVAYVKFSNRISATRIDGFSDDGEGVATALNDRGQVVGQAQDGNGFFVAFHWQDGVIEPLGSLSGPESFARDINNIGTVVGMAQTSSLEERAFIWDRINGMRSLSNLLMPGTPYTILDAQAINDRGEIAGQAIDQRSGELHAVRLQPVIDGPTLQVMEPSEGRVWVLDGTNGTPVSSYEVEFAGLPVEVVDGPNGTLLLSDGHGVIWMLDRDGSLIEDFVDDPGLEFRGLTKAPAGLTVGVTHLGLQLWDAAGIPDFLLAGSYSDITFERVAGRPLYLVSSRDTGNVQAFNLSGGFIGETTVREVERPGQAALLFGNRIAVCEETDGYYVYRLNGTTERLVEMDGQTRGLAALTNGRAVVATSHGLFIHDAFGQTVATIGEGASFGMIGETSNYRLN